MHRILFVFILFFLTTWSLPVKTVSAADISKGDMHGGDLLVLCTSKKDEDKGRCAGYIHGIIDYHKLTRSLGTAPTIDFCLPDSLSDTDRMAIVIQYLSANPQHHDFVASPAIALAFFDLFPCQP